MTRAESRDRTKSQDRIEDRPRIEDSEASIFSYKYCIDCIIVVAKTAHTTHFTRALDILVSTCRITYRVVLAYFVNLFPSKLTRNNRKYISDGRKEIATIGEPLFCFAVLNTIYILYGSFIGNTQLMLLMWDFDAGHVLSHWQRIQLQCDRFWQ